MTGKEWLNSERPNILLTSVGRRTYLVNWFKDALSGRGLVCAVNSDAAVPAFAAADIAEVSPLIYSDEYIPFLLDFCERNRVGAIIPLFDVDIPILSIHKEEFKAMGILPVVASEKIALSCADKCETSRLLDGAGILHPATFTSAEGFLAGVQAGKVSFPAFVKPRWGMGSIGLAVAANSEELSVLCGVVARKVAATYLKYESAEDPGHSVIVQPYVQGQEYGMDVINDLRGRYRGCIVRRKLAMRAGETDVAEVLETDERFKLLAKSLSELTRHPGNMDVDVFDTDDGLAVLEMNARFGGGYPFSHMAGVNLPAALVAWLRGREVPLDALKPRTTGIFMKEMHLVGVEGGRQ